MLDPILAGAAQRVGAEVRYAAQVNRVLRNGAERVVGVQWLDPLTAHGVTDALRDAELLARAVLATPAGGRHRRTALRDYEQSRDELSGMLFALTERIASYTWNFDELRTLLRELSRAMRPEVDHLVGLDLSVSTAA